MPAARDYNRGRLFRTVPSWPSCVESALGEGEEDTTRPPQFYLNGHKTNRCKTSGSSRGMGPGMGLD
ncbi:unnamed protein product [Knipowitschia caucasica]|uniref:Uncharacterized protein n=1 Tax=Knipowitschia caucasica TaxID=637954 RepID=A0AAV2KAA8_KNICA